MIGMSNTFCPVPVLADTGTLIRQRWEARESTKRTNQLDGRKVGISRRGNSIYERVAECKDANEM